MNSFISEMPGPEVGVNARAPAQPAPITMPMAASSSSAWRIAKRFFLVSGSWRYFWQKPRKASISDVDGVIGYQAPTVAPAYRQPSAAAVLPSMRIASFVLSSGSRWIGSGHVEVRLRVVVAEVDRLLVRVHQRRLLAELLLQQLRG